MAAPAGAGAALIAGISALFTGPAAPPIPAFLFRRMGGK
jgi:hypothetical protein